MKVSFGEVDMEVLHSCKQQLLEAYQSWHFAEKIVKEFVETLHRLLENDEVEFAVKIAFICFLEYRTKIFFNLYRSTTYF